MHPDRSQLFETHLSLASMKAGQGKLEEAIVSLQKALALNPDHIDAHINLGALLMRQGKLEEATARYRHALSLNPNHSDAHSNLGVLLARQGKLEEAVVNLQKALALNPNHADAYSNLGVLLARQGKLEEAVVNLQKALALNPNHSDAHINLGALLMRKGKLEEAVVSLHRALALNPNHSDAHINLGAVLWRQGKLEEATARYRHALSLNPNHSDALSSLGAVLWRQGKLEEAVVSFQKALALNPNDSNVHSNIGTLLLNQGKFDEAIAFYRRAISIHPDNVQAHEGMGRALHHKGDLGEAANCYRTAIELGITSPSTPQMLAALTGEEVGPVDKGAVTSLFDEYAPRFDTHLVDELGYTTPKLMREAVRRLTHNSRRFQHALDLGCGTGLIGAQFRDIVGEIDGVDLSAKMLEEARRRQIYGKLYLEDLVVWLERAAGDSLSFDIVLSADVFVYVGNLERVFKGVRAILAGGGLFVFSVEHLAQGSFKLLPTGRFAHSIAYMRELASTHGLIVELFEQADLRKESNAKIVGTICVLKCPERL